MPLPRRRASRDFETLVTRQREGSADPREQPDQAVQAALQHPAEGRQELRQRQDRRAPTSGRASLVTRKLTRDGSATLGPFSFGVVGARDASTRSARSSRCAIAATPCFGTAPGPASSTRSSAAPARAASRSTRDEYAALAADRRRCSRGQEPTSWCATLGARMEAASEAAALRGGGAAARPDSRAIETTAQRQQAVAHWGRDQDVFGLYREGGFIEIQVLFVRAGQAHRSARPTAFDDLELRDDEVLAAVLTQFYSGRPADSRRDRAAARARGRRGARELPRASARPTESRSSARSAATKLRLVEMAAENARHSFAERRDQGTQARAHARGAAPAPRPRGVPRSASSASTSPTSRAI